MATPLRTASSGLLRENSRRSAVACTMSGARFAHCPRRDSWPAVGTMPFMLDAEARQRRPHAFHLASASMSELRPLLADRNSYKRWRGTPDSSPPASLQARS